MLSATEIFCLVNPGLNPFLLRRRIFSLLSRASLPVDMEKPRKSEKLHSKPKKKEKVKVKVKDLRTLGEQLLTSRAHINNLPILLTYITPNSPPQHALQSLLPLQAFFTPLLPKLPPVSTSTSSNSDPDPDPEFIYLTWLRSKFDDLVRSLIELLVSSQSEDALRVPYCSVLFCFSFIIFV